MKNIDFTAGYYEWLVWIDNKLVYAFNDIAEDVEDCDAEKLKIIIDDYISQMLYETHLILSDEEIKHLKTIMFEEWGSHYL